MFRIIVGVKYCFRYSQRNRRGQQYEEEVDLATLHPFVGIHHPVQRRRREKKLLKIDEVNERFPVMTYKAWRAQRERQGLSAEGGIAPQTNITGTPLLDSPPETPIVSASELHPQSSSPVLDRNELAIQPTTYLGPDSSIEPVSEKSAIEIGVAEVTSHASPVIPSSSKHRDSAFSVDADPEDEDDHSPIPNELLATSGDNCAICIEPLEDDDEVRGLTCGHCYHQTCIDPWLTQRRASCPLCKADYYVPKPPPEPSSTEENANVAALTERTTQTVTTEHWAPLFFRPFRPIGSTNNSNGSEPGYLSPSRRVDRRPAIPEEPAEIANNTTTETSAVAPPAQSPPRWPISIRLPNRFRRREENGHTDASALERGEGAQNERQS
jgi:hypothetical protein